MFLRLLKARSYFYVDDAKCEKLLDREELGISSKQPKRDIRKVPLKISRILRVILRDAGIPYERYKYLLSYCQVFRQDRALPKVGESWCLRLALSQPGLPNEIRDYLKKMT